MSELPNNGATPEPAKPIVMDCPGDGSGRTYRHSFDHWVWEGAVWTDRKRCSTCGQEKVVPACKGSVS